MSAPTIFYDGDCGLCHASVRFVIDRDEHRQFRYAPIGGETFVDRMAGIDAATLPDSILVATPDDELLVRSSAVIYLLERLPQPWRFVGRLLGFVPRFIRDLGYRLVARTRRLLFSAPNGSCPMVPKEQRLLFDP